MVSYANHFFGSLIDVESKLTPLLTIHSRKNQRKLTNVHGLFFMRHRMSDFFSDPRKIDERDILTFIVCYLVLERL